MKKMKYIFLVLGIIFLMPSCAGDDPIDQRFSSYYVAFDTKNGVQNSLSVTEGKDVMVTIYIAATKGPSITVDFNVTAPTVSNPESAKYKILNLDGTEMTSYKLTFPEGTGSQSFLFRAEDNDELDGNRRFTLKLTENSANYRLGVNTQLEEGLRMPIDVLDDEHPLKPFAGTWIVRTGNLGAFSVNAVGGAEDNVLILKSFPIYSGVTLDLPVTFDTENGTVEIAPIKGISSGFGTYMIGIVNEDDDVVAEPLLGMITPEGGLSFSGELIALITDGQNEGLAFRWWENMKFTRE